MKFKIYLSSAIAVSMGLLCLSLMAQTMPRKSNSPSPSPAVSTAPASPVKGTRPLPFHGMISTVDQNAKTFTIASKQMSHVFQVTDKTTVTKGANPATMKDITENEEASGSYWKHSDGTLEAKNVKLGPMAKTKTSASPTPSPKP